MPEQTLTPEVTRTGCLDMQVCVPKEYTDDQVKAFANGKNPCGTDLGWFITKEGNKHLAGDPERRPCAARPGCVHIMLHA